MDKASLAGTGMYVYLIGLLLTSFGITPEPGTVEMFVVQAIGVIGFVLWVIGQLRRSDLHFGLIRKTGL